MIRVQNITAETSQRHTILLEDGSLTLRLRFFPQTQSWFGSVEFQDRVTAGFRLAVGALHINSALYPFDFIVTDQSGTDLDPFRADDFEQGRCRLYMLQPDDMEDIRGLPVAF